MLEKTSQVVQWRTSVVVKMSTSKDGDGARLAGRFPWNNAFGVDVCAPCPSLTKKLGSFAVDVLGQTHERVPKPHLDLITPDSRRARKPETGLYILHRDQ
jgi:hypothetical protein